MRMTKLLWTTAFFASVLPAVSAFAVETDTTVSKIAGKPADVQYPFIAEITGTNVYVRSGNSQSKYACAKLDSPAKVTVVGEENGWAKIVPPTGCYSWIYKPSVTVDPANPTVGVLHSDNVRVWAGADHIDSRSSDSLQTRLNNGEIVELYGEQPEDEDYYRIKPPAGAYLWINVDYLRYEAPVSQDKPIVIPPRPEPKTATQTPAETAIPLPEGSQQRPQFTNLNGQKQAEPVPQPQAETPAAEPVKAVTPEAEKPAPKPASKENELLTQCYALSAGIDEELKKSLNEQNYGPAKDALEKIKADPEAGKAASYAQILLDRIDRYELAQSVTETLQKQDQQLEQAKQRIEQAHQDQLKRIPEKANYLYTGVLKASHVYTSQSGQKRYMILDHNGKILCYVVASVPSFETQLQANESKTVGINGNIISDEKSLVAVIAITEVKAMK